MSDARPGFGDNVRIRVTPETEAAGVAGLHGQVYGETTPSVTQVEVIGRPTSDYALNVHFEDRNAGLWFAPELVQLIDHAPGTEIRVGNVHIVRQPDGKWVEVKPDSASWLSRLFRGR